MVETYRYYPSLKSCWAGGKELNLVSYNSFQTVFDCHNYLLIFEKLGERIIRASLKEVKQKLSTIANWQEVDYGSLV